MTKKGKAPAKADQKIKEIKPEEQEIAHELLEAFVERGKRTGVLSYEELMEFCDRNHLSEPETNELLKTLEKENVELVMQEELEADSCLEDFEKDESKIHIKSHIETSLDYVGEEEEAEEGEEDEDGREVVKEVGEATHIADGVKCYLT